MSTSNISIVSFFIKLMVVLAVVVIVAGVAEYGLRSNFNNEDLLNVLKYRDVFIKIPDANVFIFGNSRTAYGIIPSLVEIPGYPVYNYSFSGANVSFNDDLYRKYLLKYQKKPAIVIWGVTWTMFDSKWPARSISQDYAYFPWVDIFHFPPNFYERLHLAHQRDVLNKIFKKNKNQDSNILIDKYDKGFVPLDGSYKDPKVEVKDKINNSENEVAKFNEFVRMIKGNHMKMIFVEMPEYTPGIQCESIAPNRELLETIAKTNGVLYMNYNKEYKTDMNIDRSDFIDWQHLSYRGAIRFSKMLSRDINDLIRKGKI